MPNDTDVAICRDLTGRIVTDMEEMRASTETAALAIGGLLNDIVTTATAGNTEVKESLGGFLSDESGSKPYALGDPNSTKITAMLERQSELISELINMVQDFFDRQVELTNSACEATRKIQESAEDVSQLTRLAKMLAINIQVESARLNDKGKTFAVLGDQMREFSEDVASANRTIAEAAGEFVVQMPALADESATIREGLSEFHERYESEAGSIRNEATLLTEKMQHVLDTTESRNNTILKFSQATLSHLQFQDPVSQGLQRAQHDVSKLVDVFEGSQVDDRCLSELVDEVGNSAMDREAGEVMLF